MYHPTGHMRCCAVNFVLTRIGVSIGDFAPRSSQKNQFFPPHDRDRLNSDAAAAGGGGGGGGENKADSGELFLYSPLKVVIFVAMMCGMLVLMYYFYNILGEFIPKRKPENALFRV